MAFGILEILLGVLPLLLCLYYYLTWNFDFWKKRNVKGPKPLPIFGNMKDILFGNTHLALYLKEYYDKFSNEPLIGMFSRSNPVLIIKDPDLIKDVLIRDFHIFQDRGLYVDREVDPLNQHLVNLEYARWRPLRNKLSPVFTSGKLKDMFYLIADCARHFDKYVEKIAEKKDITEVRELTAKFTTETISVCAFGLNVNTFEDNDNEFRKCGRSLFASSYGNIIRRQTQQFFPKLFRFLGPLKRSQGQRFFLKSMKQTLEYRKKNNFRRNDFVDLLMDLQKEPEKISNIEFDDVFLTGQAIIFFAAGFETSSTTMSNALYELALNPEMQAKLRMEIKEELESTKGELTYEGVKRLKYLDQVFKETLRKYPPGSILQRKSSAPYTFAGTSVSIPADIKVMIPVWAIHHDPEIYPDPEVFDPERFNEENINLRHQMNYIPFGDGPHNCIGLRFANYQSKMGIIVVINKYKVDVCERTSIPLVIDPRSIVASPLGGIYLRFSKI